jgi:octaprenyl-diphosphate synthase
VSAHEIFDLVRADLAHVEKAIDVESIGSVDTVTTIGRYLQQSGGKRLRPALLLLCARFAGGVSKTAIQLGAVVEMIHAATLVHDDVIDVAQTRRGRPSANVQWGNHTCVLAGDWLYMQAFQVALRERNFHILDLLIGLTQMMVEGELIQLDRIGKIGISEADCMEVADRKTACLFSACAKLGAVAGGADTPTEEKLGEFAWNLGMAFQLIDDMLDFTSREQTLGKPVGGDLKEGKVTLPLIYALEKATPAERILVETVLRDRSYEAASFEQIYAMIERNGGVQRTRERAQQFTDRARHLVQEFPESLSACVEYVDGAGYGTRPVERDWFQVRIRLDGGSNQV